MFYTYKTVILSTVLYYLLYTKTCKKREYNFKLDAYVQAGNWAIGIWTQCRRWSKGEYSLVNNKLFSDKPFCIYCSVIMHRYLLIVCTADFIYMSSMQPTILYYFLYIMVVVAFDLCKLNYFYTNCTYTNIIICMYRQCKRYVTFFYNPFCSSATCYYVLIYINACVRVIARHAESYFLINSCKTHYGTYMILYSYSGYDSYMNCVLHYFIVVIKMVFLNVKLYKKRTI